MYVAFGIQYCFYLLRSDRSSVEKRRNTCHIANFYHAWDSHDESSGGSGSHLTYAREALI